MFYKVAINDTSRFTGNGLTYGCTVSLSPGQLVQVPVGTQILEAIVLQQELAAPAYETKQILQILSPALLLTQAQLDLAVWIAAYYYSTLTQAIKLFLPGTDWQALLPQPQEFVRLLQPEAKLKGAKQQLIIATLPVGSPMLYKDLCMQTGAARSILQNLATKGIIELFMQVTDFVPPVPLVKALPPLNAKQQLALTTLEQSTKPTYIFGVTGSGKTEVYCHAIEDAIKAGQQVLLLVPEIFLTEHLVQRYKNYFPPENIAVIHSQLTLKNRRDLWRAIKSGEKNIVIGSRSALFSPFTKLGVIIVDEEHDWSYKQDSTPRYHIRTVTEYFAKQSTIRLVYGSATPSLEAWQAMKLGQYTTVTLPDRFSTIAPPIVHIVDLAEVPFSTEYPFSPRLIAAITDRLARKEQIVLYLNRRGTASALLCKKCRRRVMSPISQLPFTVHTDHYGREFLLDHSSDVRAPMPLTCPACNAKELISVGAGTQRAEQVLQALFPKAKTIRIDKDTLKSATSLQASLRQMESGEADILLGTQTVVKGLDLPRVTLAAVLVADIGLSLPHFRAGERVFQLLSQLIGRSGRASAGEVIIQTWRPDADEIKLAALHNVQEFTENELRMRTHIGYPPAVPMFRILARGPKAKQILQVLVNKITELAKTHSLQPQVLCAPTYFGAGNEWHILVRGPNVHTLLPLLPLGGVHIDVDPYDCL